MAISIICDGCKKQLRVKDEHAGKRVKCPVCGKSLAVPAPARIAGSVSTAGHAAPASPSARKRRKHVLLVAGLLAIVVLLAGLTLWLGVFQGGGGKHSTNLAPDSSDSDVRHRLEGILSQSGPGVERDVQALTQSLRDPNARIRLTAAFALGSAEQSPAAASSALREALRDSDPAVQIAAAMALAELGPAANDATPDLLPLVRHDNAALTGAAAVALARMGPEALDSLSKVVLAQALPDRLKTAELLAQIDESFGCAVPALAQTLRDGDAAQRKQAVLALGQIGSATQAAVPDLALLLKQRDLLQDVLEVFNGLGSRAQGAVPALVEALKDPVNESMNGEIAKTLGRIGAPALPSFIEVLQEAKDEDFQSNILTGFARGRPTAPDLVPVVVSLIKKTPPRSEFDNDRWAFVLENIAPTESPLLAEILDRWGVRVRSKEEEEETAQNSLHPVLPISELRDLATSARENMINDPARQNRVPIWAIGQMGYAGPEAVPELLSLLEDPFDGIREQAAVSLGKIRQPANQAIPALLKSLEDKSRRVRIAAGVSLAAIAPDSKEVAVGMATLLGNSDSFDEPFIVPELCRMGPAALPALAKYFDRKEGVNWSLLKDCVHFGPDAIPMLEKAARHEDPVARSAACKALSAMGPQGEKVLLAILQEPSGSRSEALAAFENCTEPPPESIIPIFLTILRSDSFPGDYLVVGKCFGRLGRAAAPVVPDLIEIMNDPKRRWRHMAAYALGEMGVVAADAVPALTEAINDDQSLLGFYALEALGKIGPDAGSAVPALTDYLKQPERKNRAWAIWALGCIGGADAVPPLLEELRKKPTKSTAQALGTVGGPALTDVILLLDSEDLALRIAAAQALGQMGDSARVAHSALMAGLQHPDPKFRAVCANALAWFGTPPKEARPALYQASRDPASGIASLCAKILARPASPPHAGRRLPPAPHGGERILMGRSGE